MVQLHYDTYYTEWYDTYRTIYSVLTLRTMFGVQVQSIQGSVGLLLTIIHKAVLIGLDVLSYRMPLTSYKYGPAEFSELETCWKRNAI